MSAGPSVSERPRPDAAFGIGKALVALALFAAVLLLAVSCGRVWFPPPAPEIGYRPLSVKTAEELAAALKEAGLLDIEPGDSVPAVVLTRMPPGLNSLAPALKKKVFFAALLPAALVVREEIRREAETLAAILNHTDTPMAAISFPGEGAAWRRRLDERRLQLLLAAADRYRAESARELLDRVRPVPVSLLLAQAAIESAWGTSRFAVEANNLFGIWTWNGPGLVPQRRDKGKRHKVRLFDSIIDGARAYALILNSRPAYAGFRALRRQGAGSLRLADGLLQYSARRERYVAAVKAMIRNNNLTAFDRCKLLR